MSSSDLIHIYFLETNFIILIAAILPNIPPRGIKETISPNEIPLSIYKLKVSESSS
jgi:hypothetical protein